MAILKIANLGHPVLRTNARPLSPDEIQSEAVQRLIDDIIETMRYHEGVGLAAPQVHVPLALIAYVEAKEGDGELSESGAPPPVRVLINPRLKPAGSTIEDDWEGCLSLKDLRGLVPRSRDVWVSGLDRQGAEVETQARGLVARIIQHECDHLEGILFMDRMKDLRNFGFVYEINKFSREVAG